MYIILEIQTTNGTPTTLVHTADNYNTAKSVFHTVLAAAALSTVDCHTAVMMDYHGNVVSSEFFTHNLTAGDLND